MNAEQHAPQAPFWVALTLFMFIVAFRISLEAWIDRNIAAIVPAWEKNLAITLSGWGLYLIFRMCFSGGTEYKFHLVEFLLIVWFGIILVSCFIAVARVSSRLATSEIGYAWLKEACKYLGWDTYQEYVHVVGILVSMTAFLVLSSVSAFVLSILA